MLKRRLIVPFLLVCGIGATLLREIIFARYYGTSEALEVFRIAFALPNMLGQGSAAVFIGAVIPLLVRAENDGRGLNFTKSLLRFNWLTALGLTTVGVLTAGWQAKLMAPGFAPELIALLASQIQVVWFLFLGLCSSFGLRSILNNREVFWPGASTGLIVASVFVVGCAAASVYVPNEPWTAQRLSYLAVAGGMAVLAIHLVVGRHELKAVFSTVASNPLIPIAVAVFSVLVYQVLNTVPRFIDRAVATDFPQGAVAALEYSFNVLTVPGILLATSFITVYYPSFVRAVAKGESQLPFATKFLFIFVLALMLGLMLFFEALPVVDVVYGRGAFDTMAAAETANFLRWHALGLPFMVSSIILANGILGHRKIRWLIVVGVVRVVTKLVAVRILVPAMGTKGLAISFAVTEAVTMLVMLILFKSLLLGPVARSVDSRG